MCYIMALTCVCKDIPEGFRCGACSTQFTSVCELYSHMHSHSEGRSFHFDDDLKTAYPRYRYKIAQVQTDRVTLTYKEYSVKSEDLDVGTLSEPTVSLLPTEICKCSTADKCSTEEVEQVIIKQEKGKNGIGTISKWKFSENLKNMFDEDYEIAELDRENVYKDSSSEELVIGGKNENNNSKLEKTAEDLLHIASSKIGGNRYAPNLSVEEKDIEMKIANKEKHNKANPIRDRMDRNCADKIQTNIGLEENNNLEFVNNMTSFEQSSDKSRPFVLRRENSSQCDIYSKHKIDLKDSSETGLFAASYKCNFCDRTFSHRSSLTKHQKAKHSEETSVSDVSVGSYKCGYCDKGYSYPSSLLKHHRDKHFGKDFQQWNKRQRQVYYKYKCCYCDESYCFWASVIKHSQQMHVEKTKPQQKQWQCEVCAEVLYDFLSFQQHFRNEHGGFPKQNYLCEICGFETHIHDKIRQHKKAHGRGERFNCSVCSYVTYYKGCFKRHLQTHTGEKDYVCQHCGETFRQPTSLDRHILTHTGKRPYPCQFCSKTFRTSTTRKRHLNTHTDVKEYKCSECNKQFVQRGNLVAHLRQHTGEKPYKCDFCGEQFTHNVSRRNHMLKKHNFKSNSNIKSMSTSKVI